MHLGDLVTTFVNLLELEALAKPRLPTAVFDYFAGGAHDEITLGARTMGSRCGLACWWT
jgi:hypothetical protein